MNTEMLDDEQQEIDNQVTAFFRNWGKYNATAERNPYYRGEAEQALKIAAQLAQVEQAKQLKRIADRLDLLCESGTGYGGENISVLRINPMR